MNRKHKILDCHVHFAPQNDGRMLAGFLEDTGTDMANIIACSHSTQLSTVPGALKMKAEYPGRFYVFAAPDASAYTLNSEDLGEYFAGFAKLLREAGCDGIKLLEGKPQMRRLYPVPDFDLPVWEEFWTYLEENRIPLLWHVNDPENFWDSKNVPSFAVSQGWLYDDSYVNNEDQYRQVLGVLEHHPDIKICFAHFFFMSAQLDRLSGILERFRNVMVDLTPGIEMYENFSEKPEEALAFFKKYHDRICYGTDIGGRCVLMGEQKEFDRAENLRRPEIVRTFLEEKEPVLIQSDGHYLIGSPDFIMKCLGLPEDILDKIYFENFYRFAGGSPRALDPQKAELLEAAVSRRREMLSGHHSLR